MDIDKVIFTIKSTSGVVDPYIFGGWLSATESILLGIRTGKVRRIHLSEIARKLKWNGYDTDFKLVNVCFSALVAIRNENEKHFFEVDGLSNSNCCAIMSCLIASFEIFQERESREVVLRGIDIWQDKYRRQCHNARKFHSYASGMKDTFNTQKQAYRKQIAAQQIFELRTQIETVLSKTKKEKPQSIAKNNNESKDGLKFENKVYELLDELIILISNHTSHGASIKLTIENELIEIPIDKYNWPTKQLLTAATYLETVRDNETASQLSLAAYDYLVTNEKE